MSEGTRNTSDRLYVPVGTKVTITSGKYARKRAITGAHVFQKTVDYDEPGHAFHVTILDGNQEVWATIRQSQMAVGWA